ncbi:hypothetical protein PH5382_01301 [Phaeobacter sp. CECT 5382]|uniref:hypothetical protein n=1 Tax=Phaeobacter sp. CECT 5382 TaxID=1712645 RepID=UPI0006DA33FD|nr:hypothetical protein [Phaeobacter sp. CECT 5382]CUH87374.1 hypothetical protein PH5382_01301 [Phaeobacter sp. CECT 5382]
MDGTERQNIDNGAEEPVVRTRRVFYIPGYDPIHPRRYRELYRKEARAQAEISGYEIALQAQNGADKSGTAKSGRARRSYGWRVSSRIEGVEVRSDFSVLVWSDIVRDSMDASIVGTYLQLLRTVWVYVASGALARLVRLRKGPVIAALYPVGMLLLQAALAVLMFWGISAGWQTLLQQQLGTQSWLFVVPGWLVAAAASCVLLQWFKKQDGRFFAYYLMHDYAYSADSKGENSVALEARIAAFRAQIQVCLEANDVDEVLIVGHSSGAHVGVSVLADLIREGLPHEPPTLGFLTLGQVVPMVSFLPRAERLRADLRYLAARDEITWVDVSAPGDGCAFALCDPVSVSGVAPDNKRWPLVISAAFTQTLSPARWKSLRWRFFRLHFQYLCAFDRPGDYDYFRITAGARTLRARYNGRKPSRSRIDVAVSKYTSVAKG